MRLILIKKLRMKKKKEKEKNGLMKTKKSLDPLGFLGSCLDRLQKCSSAGGTGLESTLLAFGI